MKFIGVGSNIKKLVGIFWLNQKMWWIRFGKPIHMLGTEVIRVNQYMSSGVIFQYMSNLVVAVLVYDFPKGDFQDKGRICEFRAEISAFFSKKACYTWHLEDPGICIHIHIRTISHDDRRSLVM